MYKKSLLVFCLIIITFSSIAQDLITVTNKSSKGQELARVTKAEFEQSLRATGGALAAGLALKSRGNPVLLIPKSKYTFPFQTQEYLAIIPYSEYETGIEACEINGGNVAIEINNRGELRATKGNENVHCYYFAMMRGSVSYTISPTISKKSTAEN